MKLTEDPRHLMSYAHNNVKEVSGYPTADAAAGILKPGQTPQEKGPSLKDEDYRRNWISARNSINAPGYQNEEPFVYVESNPRYVDNKGETKSVGMGGEPVVVMKFNVPDAKVGSREILELGLLPKNGTGVDQLETVQALLKGNSEFQVVHAMAYLSSVRDAIAADTPENKTKVNLLQQGLSNIGLSHDKAEYTAKLQGVIDRAKGAEVQTVR